MTPFGRNHRQHPDPEGLLGRNERPASGYPILLCGGRYDRQETLCRPRECLEGPGGWQRPVVAGEVRLRAEEPRASGHARSPGCCRRSTGEPSRHRPLAARRWQPNRSFAGGRGTPPSQKNSSHLLAIRPWRHQRVAVERRILIQERDGQIVLIDDVRGVVWVSDHNLADKAGRGLRPVMVGV